MTRHLYCIGECMIEMAPAGDGHYAMGFAGDTFNTAWYARRLAGPEIEVAYHSAIGDDAVSHQMAEFIEDAGIRPDLHVIPGATVGLYVISLDNGERSFSYWRSASAARQLARDLSGLDALQKADVAYFSGITVAILPEADRTRLHRTLAEARGRGVHVAFDPNLRPRLWTSTDEMCRWITEAAKVADTVLPSFDDEAHYFGDADKPATAARYMALGAGTIIVKDGPGGVLVSESGAPNRLIPAETVPKITDTTAAGDSFNAGFLTFWMAGAPLDDAVRTGCSVAARVITKPGALVDL